MKRILLVAISILCLAALDNAYGQSDDVISLWADAGMNSCEIVDAGSGFVQVHMFHTGSQPAHGVGFLAPTPACWEGATFFGDYVAAPLGAGGNSSHGTELIIVYPECIVPPVYLGYMYFHVSGGAQPCCSYPVLPRANSVAIDIVDCNFSERAGSGGYAVVNANSSCRCPAPVATERSTWGRVKSLYR